MWQRIKALREERGQFLAQIVMRAECSPRLTPATKHIEGDRRAGLKPPPDKEVRGRLIGPVRLQPVLNVLVTGDGDEALAALPHCLGHGRTADLGGKLSTRQMTDEIIHRMMNAE